MAENDRLLEALARIAEVANEAVRGEDSFEPHEHEDDFEDDQDTETASSEDAPGCVLKSLPKRLLVRAAEVAVEINPVNALNVGPVAQIVGPSGVLSPQMAAVLTAKYWGAIPRTLTVSFTESTHSDLKTRIISHLNSWNRCCGIRFVGTNGIGIVRISRAESGYWSYLGTDIKLIPQNKPTMNLQKFTMSTPESEYRRVVRHEAGHTLGFPHEHARKSIVARIDRDKAYKWFWEKYGWDKPTVNAQVLTPLNEASLMSTPPDQTSIMCYQLPGAITKDGKPILGGKDINPTDCKFAGKVYPKAGRVPVEHDGEEDWPESEDVALALAKEMEVV